ncbi:MAG TPA: hypothetical protein PLM24_00730 [Methanothrix sp.]|nr:hypothetical protein [Methanothrix sp.]HPJ84159.1 hypothetical protein [Methanothrix sp.]HPR65641.1 hypothetical protein [Methanothrix sp.]
MQKLHEGRPNIDDAIKNGEIQLVINTTIGKANQYDEHLHPEGRHQVQGALHHHHRCGLGGGEGDRRLFKKGKSEVKSFQEYYADIER